MLKSYNAKLNFMSGKGAVAEINARPVCWPLANTD